MSRFRWAVGMALSGLVANCSVVAHAQEGGCAVSTEKGDQPWGLFAEDGLGPDPLFSVSLAGDFVVGGSNTRGNYPGWSDPPPQVDPFVVTIAGVPNLSAIVRAYANWSYLANQPYPETLARITIKGVTIVGQLTGEAGSTLCWAPYTSRTIAYTADVTDIVNQVGGNGDYVIGDIVDPWPNNDPEWLGEGFSLLIVYENAALPLKQIFLRRLYRFADQQGIDVSGNGATRLWAPNPNHGTVPRRAQVAYDRFVSWAIARNLWPDTLKPVHLRDWALTERAKPNHDWRLDYRRLQTAWDALVGTGSLPAVTFPLLPAYQNARYALVVEKWPEHLRREWERVCRAATAPLRNGGMRPWRQITRDEYQRRLTLFLGWFVREHPEVALAGETWATLLTADRCREYLNWQAQRSGKKYLNAGHTSFLRCVRGFHRFELGSSSDVVRSFTDLCRRVEVEERDKLSRVAPFPLVEKGYRRLLGEVLEGMRTSHGNRARDPAVAEGQVNALILGLLTARALRRSNIVNLRVGTNLIRGTSGYELRYTADEMKGHRRFETTVPSELTPVLDDYLRRGYFALAGRSPQDGDQLLLSARGSMLDKDALRARVRSLSRKYVGTALNPHLFRHIVATHAAQVWRMTPTELAAFLAHKNIMTVMKYYEVTNPARVAERFDAFRNGTAH